MWETRIGYTSPCSLQNCTAQTTNTYNIYIYINHHHHHHHHHHHLSITVLRQQRSCHWQLVVRSMFMRATIYIYIYIYIYMNKCTQECKTLHTCSSDTIGKSFGVAMQRKDSNTDLSSASCTNAAVACAELAALFFKVSSPAFTTLCRRWHPQRI